MKLLFPLAVVLISASITHPCGAQVGTLDPDFANDGLLSADMGLGTYDDANAVLVQPDGKIVVAGTSGYEGEHDIMVARYLPDGTPDNTFGTNGKTITSVVPGDDIACALALDANGKILVGGYTYKPEGICFVLARYDSGGDLDPGFGIGGVVVTSTEGSLTVEGRSVAVQADGKILLAGGGLGGFALMRYTTSGTPDAGFGTAGLVTVPFGSGGSQANGVAVRSDGRIVLAGYSVGAVLDSMAVAQLNADGTLDATFDGDGKNQANVPSQGTLGRGMALAPDGSLFVVGGTATDAAIAHFTSEGALDPDFAGSGVRLLANAYDSHAFAVAVQPDGKPVIVGRIASNVNDFLLMRLNTDGTDDALFGNAGTTTTDFTGTFDVADAIALQADGNIVLAGATNAGPQDYNFAVARYLAPSSVGITTIGSLNNGMSVYPNPVRSDERITLTCSVIDAIAIELLDPCGSVVQRWQAQRANSGMIRQDLLVDGSVPSGVYVLSIVGEGSTRTTHVMIIGSR